MGFRQNLQTFYEKIFRNNRLIGMLVELIILTMKSQAQIRMKYKNTFVVKWVALIRLPGGQF